MTKLMAEEVLNLLEIYDKMGAITEEYADRFDALSADDDTTTEQLLDAEALWDMAYAMEMGALQNAAMKLHIASHKKIDYPTARKLITDRREELEKILNKVHA